MCCYIQIINNKNIIFNLMDKVLIGFDFSMNKPAATIYFKG